MPQALPRRNVRGRKERDLRRKEENRNKKEYERLLVNDLKAKIRNDKEMEVKKRKDYKELAWEMLRENEVNKKIRMDEKARIRELDIRLGLEYVAKVDADERKKRAEF